MQKITLSIATGIRGNSANKTYSTQAEITSLEALKEAVQYDHVGGMFRNNERSNDNFISTDCVMMDCDNEKSDKAGEWLSPEKLHERMSDVAFAVIYSKSHMIDKKDKTARPRFHVYFPLKDTITEAGHVRRLKASLLAIVPEFDGQAKDAARFFFGVSKPQGNVYEGMKCVDEVIPLTEAQEETPSSHVDMAESPRKVSTPQEGYTRPYSPTNTADIARVINQFETFIYDSGVRPLYPLRIIPDGETHRFETEEDTHSTNTGKAGSYRLYIEGYPIGYVEDWRKGIKREFRYDFSAEERREYGMRNAQQRAQDEEKRREAERKKEEAKKLHEEEKKQAREKALAEYRASSYDLSANGYFRARFTEQGISIKDVNTTRYKESYIGHEVFYECEVIRQYPLRVCLGAIQELLTGEKVTALCRKGELIVPFQNVETGQFQTLQRINHEGQKCFYHGLSPKGAAFVMWPVNKWREDVNTTQTDIDTVKTVFVCEGVCTALALWQDCNGEYPVYSVGGWDNLAFVCAGLKKWLSNKVKIVIVADNDNSGLSAAEICIEAGLAETIRKPEIAGQDWYDKFIAKYKKGIKA